MTRTARLAAWGCACGLALVVGLYVHATVAVGPRLRVISTSAAPCANGDPAPMVAPGQPFEVRIDGFAPNTPVDLAITFADGRVVGAGVLAPPDRSVPTEAFTARTDEGGVATLSLPVAGTWPPGCYGISAFAGREVAHARFALQSYSTGPVAVGRADLRVVNQDTQQPTGLQGETEAVIGSGFRSSDLLLMRIIAPDGAVIPGPSVQSDAVGRVVTSYDFDESFAPGSYDIMLVGSDGARAKAQFKLLPLPVAAQGGAKVRISEPFPAHISQQQPFQFRGESFAPGENVRLVAVQPNGGRTTLATVITDETGMFRADALLGVALPTGIYRVLAEGSGSGARAVTSLTLRPADLAQLLAASPAPPVLPTPEPVTPTNVPPSPVPFVVAPPVAEPPSPVPFVVEPPVIMFTAIPLYEPPTPSLPTSEPLPEPTPLSQNVLPTPPF